MDKTTLEDFFSHALRFSPVLLFIIILSLLFIYNFTIIHDMQSRDNGRVVKYMTKQKLTALQKLAPPAYDTFPYRTHQHLPRGTYHSSPKTPILHVCKRACKAGL